MCPDLLDLLDEDELDTSGWYPRSRVRFVPHTGEEDVNEALHSEYMRASVALAQAVSIDDRIATDPNYPADRSARAARMRADDMPHLLACFRAAESAFLDAA